jgi:hypothetical protein
MPPDRFAELQRRREQKPAPDALQPVPSREPVTRSGDLAQELLAEAGERQLESGELLLVSEEASLADLETAAERIAPAVELPLPTEEDLAGEPLLASLDAPRLFSSRIYAISGWEPPLGQHLKLLAGALKSGREVGQVMLVGHVETLPERVEHLGRLRELLDWAAGIPDCSGKLVLAVRQAEDGDLASGDPGAVASVAAAARPSRPDVDRRHAVAVARLALGPNMVCAS